MYGENRVTSLVFDDESPTITSTGAPPHLRVMKGPQPVAPWSVRVIRTFFLHPHVTVSSTLNLSVYGKSGSAKVKPVELEVARLISPVGHEPQAMLLGGITVLLCRLDLPTYTFTSPQVK